MFSLFFFGIISFLGLWLVVHLVARFQKKSGGDLPSSSPAAGPSGSVRGVYQLFFIFILWSLLVFVVPLLLSYRQHIMAAATKREVLEILSKAIFLPALFLLIIFYGHKKGFLRWLSERDWPQDR